MPGGKGWYPRMASFDFRSRLRHLTEIKMVVPPMQKKPEAYLICVEDAEAKGGPSFSSTKIN